MSERWVRLRERGERDFNLKLFVRWVIDGLD